MRERHFPRLCRTCRAPMARQEDTCWRCGAQWASEDTPPTRLKVLAGGADPVSDALQDADRWANEGGSVALEAAAHTR
jgi:predicted amidophosphoribosyltransferase